MAETLVSKGRIPLESIMCPRNWRDETPSSHLLEWISTPYSLNHSKMR